MRFSVITLFPQIFEALGYGLMGKALKSGLLDVQCLDLRPFGVGPHLQVDDRPFSGGAGMVMKPEPMAAAVRSLGSGPKIRIFLSPRGRSFDQKMARQFLNFDHILIACGRYEGLDQRVLESCFDLELSVGPYVLNGGEVAALAVIEAVGRLVPGFMGNQDSAQEETQDGEIEASQYTRPAEWEGLSVPAALLSGNPKTIKTWKKENAIGYKPLDRFNLGESS